MSDTTEEFLKYIRIKFKNSPYYHHNELKKLYQEFCDREGNPEIEERVIDEFATTIRSRRDFGRNKYKTTMERDDLSTVDWLQHAKEEALDFAIYVQKLQRDFKEELYDVDKMNDLVEENQRLKKYEDAIRKIDIQMDDARGVIPNCDIMQNISRLIEEAYSK